MRPWLYAPLAVWFIGFVGMVGLGREVLHWVGVGGDTADVVLFPLGALWCWVPYRIAKWGDEQFQAGVRRGRAQLPPTGVTDGDR